MPVRAHEKATHSEAYLSRLPEEVATAEARCPRHSVDPIGCRRRGRRRWAWVLGFCLSSLGPVSLADARSPDLLWIADVCDGPDFEEVVGALSMVGLSAHSLPPLVKPVLMVAEIISVDGAPCVPPALRSACANRAPPPTKPFPDA